MTEYVVVDLTDRGIAQRFEEARACAKHPVVVHCMVSRTCDARLIDGEYLPWRREGDVLVADATWRCPCGWVRDGVVRYRERSAR